MHYHPLQLRFQVAEQSGELVLVVYGERLNSPCNEMMQLFSHDISNPSPIKNTTKSNTCCIVSFPLRSITPSTHFTLRSIDCAPITRYVPCILFTPQASTLDETKVPQQDTPNVRAEFMQRFAEDLRREVAKNAYSKWSDFDDFDEMPF